MKSLIRICNNNENLARKMVACHSQNLPAHALHLINAGISADTRQAIIVTNSKSSQHNYQTENNTIQLYGQSSFVIFDVSKNRVIGTTNIIKTQFREINGGMASFAKNMIYHLNYWLMQMVMCVRLTASSIKKVCLEIPFLELNAQLFSSMRKELFAPSGARSKLMVMWSK